MTLTDAFRGVAEAFAIDILGSVSDALWRPGMYTRSARRLPLEPSTTPRKRPTTTPGGTEQRDRSEKAEELPQASLEAQPRQRYKDRCPAGASAARRHCRK